MHSGEIHSPSADLSSEKEFVVSEREAWDDTSALRRETQQGYTSSMESQPDANKHDIVRHCALNMNFFFVVLHLNCVFTSYMELNHLKRDYCIIS